ncbi:alpha/beta hydrolase [Aeromicrobium sp. PE09-221]|uniref:RBBP9/YdeN family alpha/beta hydrolase n=1 Tax=Aeromicrobium sp. PE09-221 TaxID=1898043 RepID=UPI000B3EAD78|nr:alpha/beta hydrolase [Aeromicrobium sp. PE09-221]OUZ12861.1 alpha/beta hydrolase [Aeromicrobium sp. PE09-221]
MTSETTRQRAVIFHGYGATPDDHWFGWLADRLREDGITTTIPALPDPLDPDPHRWGRTIGETLGVPDKQTTVVAHSLGCLATLRYLHSLSAAWHLNTLVLVAGFVDRLPALPELDEFIGDRLNLTDLDDHIDRLVVIRSDDDPLVPPALTDRLAGLLGVPAQIVPGAGHFLATDGISALPSAYDAATSSRCPPGSPG